METNEIDINYIIIIAIVVLISIIVLLAIYFIITTVIKKKKGKKADSLFNPSNLVEEDSLVKIMDEKKNVEFKRNDTSSFVQSPEQVNIVTNQATESQAPVNPFGVNMNTQENNNNKDPNPTFFDIPNNNNRFIK